MKRRSSGEGSPRRRPNGTWEVQYARPDGRRASVYGKTQAEALRKYRALKAAADAGRRVPDSTATVAEVAADWLDYTVKPNLAKNTVRVYDNALRNHILPRLGALRVADVRPLDVRRFLALEGQTLTPETVGAIKTALSGVLEAAVEQGLIPHSPVPPRLGRKGRAVADAPRPTAGDALRALHAARGTRWEALVTLLLALGLREGEALGLTWDRVDLAGGQVRIDRQLQYYRGEGFALEPLKTAASRRVLPLPPTLAALLVARGEERVVERSLAGDRWDGRWPLVFAGRRGQPLQGGYVLRELRTLWGRAGLPPWRVHDLRHACATLLYAGGAGDKDVQAHLGHASVATTADIYLHLDEGARRDVAARLEDIIKGDA